MSEVFTAPTTHVKVEAQSPTIICLTPVKNEAWILDRFIQCTRMWADHIIIADQGSTDESREIAARYPEVILIENPNPSYDEFYRQELLIKRAREIEGPRLLIAIDADEILSANWKDSPEWKTIQQAKPGTAIYMQWANIAPDMQHCWLSKQVAVGYLDDGRPHQGHTIHTPRIPISPDTPKIVLQDIKLLHYQYTNWERMKSKQRWYQCWERIHSPKKRPTTLFRQYHTMDTAFEQKLTPIREHWIKGYVETGIDMTSVRIEPTYYWDCEVIRWMQEYGAAYFKKLDIWDVNWVEKAQQCGHKSAEHSLRDPRNILDRTILEWLKFTQGKSEHISIRLAQQFLRILGW